MSSNLTAANSTSLERFELRASAKTHEPDRYLAALLAPPNLRDDLVTLAAYFGELGRIGEAVREAPLAEIRLQWWRDALGSADRTGNPVADAFGELARRHQFGRAQLADYFDALAHTYYADPPPNEGALFLELQFLEGTPFALAARIAGGEDLSADPSLMHDAAVAYGLARRGLRFPHALARGRNPLPPKASGERSTSQSRDDLCNLARAKLASLKPAYEGAPEPIKRALLPLALVEPYLQVLEEQGHDIAHDIGDVSPLKRVWRIWRAHRSGRM